MRTKRCRSVIGLAFVLLSLYSTFCLAQRGEGRPTALPTYPVPVRGENVYAFDFQPESGPLADGFTKVAPDTLYSQQRGYGFQTRPRAATDGSNKIWKIFGRSFSIDRSVPTSVLSRATVDCITDGRSMTFYADVTPGSYDVTLWLGDVTSPRHRVRATLNGVTVDIERMDINVYRGNLWVDAPRNKPQFMGTAVPRTVRVEAPTGKIELILGMSPGGGRPIEWTYVQDEDPKQDPYETTQVLVPAYRAASVQAMILRPAGDPPFSPSRDGLIVGSTFANPQVQQAVDSFNAGNLEEAVSAFQSLDHNDERVVRAAGLLWCAGHPAIIKNEREFLGEAKLLLQAVLADNPEDHIAVQLLILATICDDAHRYREMYGYGDYSATENMGRSCSLVEQFQPDHPYYWKGRILYIRNRAGLDPRRVTVSWERAQWMARQMDTQWGQVNPYVHLYATDEWTNNGQPWTFIDWGALAGPGPEWARSLVGSLNAWLDLFEWWSIFRQSPEGDIGGGWTDDVEIVPAFGLMSFVLDGASDVTENAVIKFADGIWNSDIMDRERAYQKQYADVEHTAEPTGNMLHVHLLARFGDPEAVERIIKSAHTVVNTFMTDGNDSPDGHRHFKGNHMSSTKIATNPKHRADIPLCGRATTPLPYLAWYSNNPGVVEPLRDWTAAWVADAQKTTNRKPAGVFPQMVWTPTDTIGDPANNNWWSNFFGQHGAGAFPSYQYYLYNLAGFFYLRAGEEQFRQPLDTLQDLTLAWDSAGRPNLGNQPPTGREGLWCGSKLKSVGAGATLNVAVGTGLSDWDTYLAAFGGSYARYLQNPTHPDPLSALDHNTQILKDSWPYRTTEGLMTDRIMLGGWADVISYYIGSEVFSTFFGMPVHAVTWSDTSRLFAASIHKATKSQVDVTTYLFSDRARTARIHLWQLAMDRDYILEAGPASGLGQASDSIDQTIPFTLTRRGQGVAFQLPARRVYALQIRPASSEAGPTDVPTSQPSLLPDIAIAPADISYQTRTQELTIRIHNLGAAGAENVLIRIFEGADANGTPLGDRTLARLEAPLDLVPKWQDISLTYRPVVWPTQIYVSLDPQNAMAEVTKVNNTASAFLGTTAPENDPPMIVEVLPNTVKAGQALSLFGRNFMSEAEALLSEASTSLLDVTYIDANHVRVQTVEDMPSGDYIIAIKNPDGKTSNIVPLYVTP